MAGGWGGSKATPQDNARALGHSALPPDAPTTRFESMLSLFSRKPSALRFDQADVLDMVFVQPGQESILLLGKLDLGHVRGIQR